MENSTVKLGGISLKKLLPDAKIISSDDGRDGDIRARCCTNDSRCCLPGDLFAAMVGTEIDGHDFAGDAVARGASALLCEREIPSLSIPQCVVPDTRIAYGLICQAIAGNPSHRVKVVGITGTNGKTTTTQLLAAIFRAAGLQCGTLGTLGLHDGNEYARSELTTPEAHTSAAWLARMEATGCQFAVMEVSSHALSQHRTAGILWDAACITNISRDHLDYHGSLRQYRSAKSRIFDQLSPDGFAVLNVDDSASVGLLSQIQHPVLTIGVHGRSELSATPLEQCRSEQTFLLTAGSDNVPVRTQIVGTPHIYNCLSAAAVGLLYGINLEMIVRGLESVETIPGRMERIECGQPYSVFVDYAHTPDALSGVLESLRQVIPGRIICLFGAGGDRDRLKRPEMARAVEGNADHIIVTSDNPRCEDPLRIIEDLVNGFENRANVSAITSREEAIAHALSLAEEGDCVLIAGKGHEDCQIIGHVRYPFDDREIARRWLYLNTPENAGWGSMQ